MKKSETVGALAKALAKVQGAIKPAPKGAENPFFKSHYADLPAIVKACRKELAENDIAYIQAPYYENDTVVLETVLVHSSGEWISGTYPVKPIKSDPQSLGSATTYARRYALAAMVGVVAEDEDDDGNAASAKTPQKPAAVPEPPKFDDEDGQLRAWVDKQKAKIDMAQRIPDLMMWLDEHGGEKITDPDSGTPLDRLKRKSEPFYKELVKHYQAKMESLQRKAA